jgi:hypothetical protein
MHPVKHKAMMQQLTRPGTLEQAKKAEENNKKYLADRRAKTLKSYGLTEKDLKPAAMDPQTLKPGNTFNDIGRNFLIEESKSRDLSSEEVQYLKNDEKLKNKPSNKKPVVKPTVKKTIKPYEPQKIDPFISDPYSAIEPKPVASIDPKLKELEERFLAAQEQSYQEKVKKNTKGLRSFAPIKVNRDV